MKELLEKAVSNREKARAITFYHLRYVKVHPFIDGNGRSARVIANLQSEKLLGKRLNVDFDHKVYIKDIKTAFGKKVEIKLKESSRYGRGSIDIHEVREQSKGMER